MTNPDDIPKQYDAGAAEAAARALWTREKAGAAAPDDREDRYVVMMPLPNVTGALHMGHAMDNVMQDLLVRYHRLRGHNTLWMAGTDHAGIATQAVVEKRLKELEGKTRHDVGRKALVERIWAWKEQYQARIVAQQEAMGCSCDWDRQRFTMDDVCARAVRHTFFHMFRDGLIYRGDRLVNWDCHLQTAVADDEIVHESVDGHFWHLQYPVSNPKAGEPTHVTVATTRPETMLGDTAVACHPDPKRELDRRIVETRERVAKANDKERPDAEAELERLEARKTTHLPALLQFRDMALDGRKLVLPLQDREIPIILDEWAKPELGSGCVKITPAHDPNDHEVWKRHQDSIDIINILTDDGTLNDNAGAYAGLDRFDARKEVVADLDAKGLLERVEDRVVEVGHSDRSKTPVEPYMSKQWFVRMGDVEGGIVCGRGTELEFKTTGLAQAAIDAVGGSWTSGTGRKLTFHPDARYAKTYLSWLSEKRDWCISRQLWWGHQIPIWKKKLSAETLESVKSELAELDARDDVVVRIGHDDGSTQRLPEARVSGSEELEVLVCLQDRPTDEAVAAELESLGLEQDPDVLDTWFSSGLWPHSTLGWPDADSAPTGPNQSPLASVNGHPNALDYYYPGSCLVTGRDIITLWVARMVLMGLYNLGDLPFTDSFIHTNILDGKGVRMSKSKGNGIDPVDIIDRYGADAMRYVLCELQTGSQDTRLPVQAISPFTGNSIELADAKHGSTMYTYICPESGKEFDVLGTMEDVPAAKLISDRFDVGRNFCNKLWNATRFALMNVGQAKFSPLDPGALQIEDRWILSRLARAVVDVGDHIGRYNPAAAIAAARDFFWSDVCDSYLEYAKPRLHGDNPDPVASQIVAAVLDQVLRLLHPFVPFITEDLFGRLTAQVPQRGFDTALENSVTLARAAWPASRPEWIDGEAERITELLQELVRVVRDARRENNVPPSKPLEVSIRVSKDGLQDLEVVSRLFEHLARIGSLELSETAQRRSDSATQVVSGVEVFVHGVVDLEKERKRLTKERDALAKRLDGTRKKLGNENFTSRAAPEVVERERANEQSIEQELLAITKSLESLDAG